MSNKMINEIDENEICKDCNGTVCTCPDKDIDFRILYKDVNQNKVIFEKPEILEKEEEKKIPICKIFKDFFWFLYN